MHLLMWYDALNCRAHYTIMLCLQLSQLLPLVKSGRLVVPGYCEPLVAADGFKMFLTRRLCMCYQLFCSLWPHCSRLSQDGCKVFVSGSSLLSVLEGHVTSIRVPQYSKEEIVQVGVYCCPCYMCVLCTDIVQYLSCNGVTSWSVGVYSDTIKWSCWFTQAKKVVWSIIPIHP